MSVVLPEPAGMLTHTTGFSRALSSMPKSLFRGKTRDILGLVILVIEVRFCAIHFPPQTLRALAQRKRLNNSDDALRSKNRNVLIVSSFKNCG